MPDQTPAAGHDGAGEGADNGGAPKNPPAPDANKGADGTGRDDKGGDGGGGDGAAKPNDPNAKAPQDKGTPDNADDGKDPDTRDRPDPKDFIIRRQGRKIEKMQKQNAGAGAQNGDDDEDDGTPEGDEVAPEDEATITKVVAKKFAPVFAQTIAAQDDREVGEFLKNNPDFAPYEAKARRFMQHESRRHLPIETIFAEVVGIQGLVKIGAERERKAAEKAKATQTGGGTPRAGEGGEKSVWDMTPDEFRAEQERVRRGQ